MSATFKKEMDFSLDNFGNQKYYTASESIGNAILNLFFMRPGCMPSMPHLGLNINKYLYNLEDEIDVNEIKNNLTSQCSELLPYLILGEVRVFLQTIKGQSVLMITIQVETDGTEAETLIYGFSKSKTDGETLYNFQRVNL